MTEELLKEANRLKRLMDAAEQAADSFAVIENYQDSGMCVECGEKSIEIPDEFRSVVAKQLQSTFRALWGNLHHQFLSLNEQTLNQK